MDNHPDPMSPARRRPTWMWRLSMLMGFAILGIATTLVIWWSAMRDSNRMAAASLSQVAREIHGVLNVRVDRHVEALRNLAQFWQLHGLLPQEAWDFNCEMMIRNFRGIEWIAWVNARTGASRFAARDTTLRLDPEIIHMARDRARAPGSETRVQSAGEVLVFTPVRTPQDSVGQRRAGAGTTCRSTAVSLIHGVRGGTRSLLGMLKRRAQPTHSNGGVHDAQSSL